MPKHSCPGTALCAALTLRVPGTENGRALELWYLVQKEPSIDFVENHDGARTPPLDPRALRSRIAGVGGRVADGF